MTTFHTDPEAQFETVMKVRTDETGEPPFPNWTAVGVTWLAGFEFEISSEKQLRACFGSAVQSHHSKAGEFAFEKQKRAIFQSPSSLLFKMNSSCPTLAARRPVASEIT